MFKQYSLLLSLLVLIQSCGGSDSTSNSDTNTNNPVEYQFSLSAQLSNQCKEQVPFTQVELLLQDENWQLIETYRADANGQVSFTTTQTSINYTLVAKSQQGNGVEGLDIVSFYQANTSTPAQYSATYDQLVDNTNCECVTQNIKLEHRVFSSIDSVSTSFTYGDWQRLDEQTTYFTDAEVCRSLQGEWPIQSIAIRGTDTNNNAIGVASLLSDFISNDENLWQAAAIEVADLAPLPQEHAGFESSQLFAGNEHFYTQVNEADENIRVFNSHQYTSESLYQSQAHHEFERLETLFGHSIFGSFHQKKSTAYDEAYTVLAETDQPEIDNTSYSELAADGSYDYSELAGYPMVKFTFGYQVNASNAGEAMPIRWTMFGPIKGKLASSVQLAGYENIITPETSIQSTDIKIIKSATTNSYNDYIKYYQGNTESDFDHDLKYFHLQLVL